MKILWVWDGNQGKFYYSENKKEDTVSFQKHKESMKKFRQSHPKVEVPKPREIGEACKANNFKQADFLGIVPVQRVQLGRYAQN